MKKTLLISIIGLTTILAGCSKVTNLANINVDLPYNTQVTVPQVQGYTTGVALPQGDLELPAVTTGFATNAQSYLAQYSTSASEILNVYLKSMAITIQAPANQNFDFLDNIQVYISTSTLPQVLMASASGIPEGATTLNLTANTDVNLKNYILADTAYITMTAHVNAAPATGETLNINTVFHMLANPLD